MPFSDDRKSSPYCLIRAIFFMKNMEIIDFLNKKIQERFSSNAAVEEIESIIRKQVERKTYELYFKTPLLKDNLEFELIGVKASFYSDYQNITCDREIEIELAYVCKSKLPKDRQEKVLAVKEKYQQYKRLEWNTFKIPLWHTLLYTLEVEEALSGEINLDIS